MTQLNIALATIGALVLGLGIVSQRMKRSWLQEPLIAVGLGVLIGPGVLNWLDMATWGAPIRILEEGARLTLAVGLMGVALRLSHRDMRELWRPVAILLTLGMLGMWALSSAIVGWLLGLPLMMALLIGAAITPTDPIVASSIVTGPMARKYLPGHIRGSLSLEAGANDGLAYVLVLLPILLLSASPADAWRDWLVHALLIGVLLAAVVGMVIGYFAAWVLHWAERHAYIENYSFLSYTVALSLFTLGAASLIGADALISVFAAGLAFNLAATPSEKHKEESVQEAVNKLFSLPIFVMFGLALPWGDWHALGAPLAAAAGAILAFRRLPVIAALSPLLAARYSRADRAYIGWFGPIGIAAVYYAAFASGRTGEDGIWTIASAIILASIVAHSITATPLTRLYGAR